MAVGGYRLALAPDHLRGRTSAAVRALTAGALSLGTMLGGTLIAVLGVRAATLALAGWLGMLALATTLNPRIRGARAGDPVGVPATSPVSVDAAGPAD